MSLRALDQAPEALAYLPEPSRFRFFELFDARGTYGFGALAEAADCLEVHLEVVRFGPRALACLRRDTAWLRAEARRLGKPRILALRADLTAPDPRWPKFTRLLGFTGHCVVQMARLDAG